MAPLLAAINAVALLTSVETSQHQQLVPLVLPSLAAVVVVVAALAACVEALEALAVTIAVAIAVSRLLPAVLVTVATAALAVTQWGQQRDSSLPCTTSRESQRNLCQGGGCW